MVQVLGKGRYYLSVFGYWTQGGRFGRRGAPVDRSGIFRHASEMTLVLANLLRATVLVVLSFALVATGLAHRLPTAVQDDSLAFALQNGISLSDFCGGDLDEPMHPGTDCQACQTIGAGGLLPVSGIQIDLELACHSDVFAKLEFRAILRSPDLAHRPQGPPVA